MHFSLKIIEKVLSN